jgi:hypothetical protein
MKKFLLTVAVGLLATGAFAQDVAVPDSQNLFDAHKSGLAATVLVNTPQEVASGLPATVVTILGPAKMITSRYKSLDAFLADAKAHDFVKAVVKNDMVKPNTFDVILRNMNIQPAQ